MNTEPGGQTLHPLILSFIIAPNGQKEQPVDQEYLPAAQFEQVALPPEAEYLPAAQFEQVALPSEAEYLPAAQFEQVALEVASITEDAFPAMQSLQK